MSGIWCANIFSQTVEYQFIFDTNFLCCIKVFWFDVASFIFAFVSLAVEIQPLNTSLGLISKSVSPIVFYVFYGFRYMSKCFIHVKLILGYGASGLVPFFFVAVQF